MVPNKRDKFAEYLGKHFIFNPKGTTTKYPAIFRNLIEDENKLWCKIHISDVGTLKVEATDPLLKQIKSRSNSLL